MFIAIISVYLIAQVVIFSHQDTTNYIVAKKGEIVDAFSANGVVVREETLVRAPSDGVIEYYYPSGVELSSNTKVCSLLNDTYGDLLQEKIDELYAQMQDVDTGEYEEVFAALNEDISKSVSSYLRSKSTNGYASLYTLQDDLIDDVSKRKDMYSLMSNSQITSLLAEQGIYLDEQSAVIKDIYLSEAGFIDYSYDSYEGWTVDQIGPDFIDSYDSQYSYFELNLQKVSSGDPLYRFISSPIWHIVVYLDSEQAEYFDGESTISFIYNSTEEISGTVESLDQVGDDQYKLVLKMNSYIENYLTDRIVSLVFTKNSHSGIKISSSCIVTHDAYVIPSSYLTTVDGQEGVYVVSTSAQGETKTFVTLTIIKEKDDKVYFDLPGDLTPGSIIEDPDTGEQMAISETAEVYGVYVVNGGFQQFKGIDIVYESQGYAIVTGVDMYDRVRVGVSDN